MSKIKQMLEVDINAIRPNTFNTNEVSPENELKLEKSVQRFDVYKPVICRELPDGTLEIIGGEHRWLAAKKLGHKSIPIVNLGQISDDRAKEIMLVDNARYGEDDSLKLAELLMGMDNPNELTDFTPLTAEDYASIFSSTSIDLDDLNSDSSNLPDLDSISKKKQTHQVMRFKVPIEDAEFIQKRIEMVMKTQGFTQEDSMANAGNALVHIFKEK